jgi:hypothetical protein
MSELPEDDGLPLLTRRDAVRFVNDELGIPLKHSTWAKKAMRGEAPPPASYYGKVELHTRKAVREWALSLCTDKPAKLNTA